MLYSNALPMQPASRLLSTLLLRDKRKKWTSSVTQRRCPNQSYLFPFSYCGAADRQYGKTSHNIFLPPYFRHGWRGALPRNPPPANGKRVFGGGGGGEEAPFVALWRQRTKVLNRMRAKLTDGRGGSTEEGKFVQPSFHGRNKEEEERPSPPSHEGEIQKAASSFLSLLFS